MFRATNSSILRSNFWLYIQLLVQCTDTAADRCHGWDGNYLPHGTTCLLLDECPWNTLSEYFSKICHGNSSPIKIEQEFRVLYMQPNIHFWSNLGKFFLEWKMFQIKVVEEIEAHILCSITYVFFENRAVYEIMWKNIIERCWPQMIIGRLRIACWTPRALQIHAQLV